MMVPSIKTDPYNSNGRKRTRPLGKGVFHRPARTNAPKKRYHLSV